MTRQLAQPLVERLIDAFPQTPMRAQTAAIYTRMLGDLDGPAADRVVEGLIASSPSFPTVAEIRNAVAEEVLAIPTALEAYASIFDRDEAKEIHELTRRVADLFGGFYNLRTSESPSITRAQFLKTYTEMRDEQIRSANLRGLRAA
jgi:ABC-type transport system involved in cytochrome bd biosynthesis fused ATPase/permease subunit